MTVTSSHVCTVPQNVWESVRRRLKESGYGLSPKYEGGRFVFRNGFNARIEANGDRIMVIPAFESFPDEYLGVQQIVRGAFQAWRSLLSTKILMALEQGDRGYTELLIGSGCNSDSKGFELQLEELKRDGFIELIPGVSVHGTYSITENGRSAIGGAA